MKEDGNVIFPSSLYSNEMVGLQFIINPHTKLWIAYSNFIVSVATGGETATLSLRSQMKTYPLSRGLN